MSASRKRYAVVGVGSRSSMYTKAIARDYTEVAELVGLCDTNQARMDLRKRQLGEGYEDLPTYPAGRFDRMIAETKPDAVIVTSMDVTHSDYIVRAMKLGCDVVLLDDVFLLDPPADPLGRKAGELDGAYSILTGIAAYTSIDAGRAIKIAELVDPSLLKG